MSARDAIREDVELLCSFRARRAGSDAERRAAKRFAGRLEGGGRRVATEPIHVHPRWAAVHLLHCLLAAAGSLLAAVSPALGFALVLIAATSAYLDLSGRFYLLRRIPFRRASQNVYARATATPKGRGEPGGRERVILCANLDAPWTGAVYNRLPMRLLDLLARRLPVVSSPTRLWFWSIALLLPVLGARMAGLDWGWLPILQLPQTLILILGCFALGEIALSPPAPGANANASGVAALLEALRRLDADPPQAVTVEALLIGGGETTMEGMRAFLRAHRRELERERTRFISFESVGRGEPRFLTSQGPAISLPLDRELVGLCEAVATAAREGGEDRPPAPLRDGRTSAAFVARAHRYPALAITSREPGRALPADHHSPADVPGVLDEPAIERAAGLAVAVIHLLDRDLSRRRKPA